MFPMEWGGFDKLGTFWTIFFIVMFVKLAIKFVVHANHRRSDDTWEKRKNDHDYKPKRDEQVYYTLGDDGELVEVEPAEVSRQPDHSS
jgi:hypothetical protein